MAKPKAKELLDNQKAKAAGLVPRYPLQKPPSRGLEGSGGEGGGGRRSKGASPSEGFKGASRGLEGGFKGA